MKATSPLSSHSAAVAVSDRARGGNEAAGRQGRRRPHPKTEKEAYVKNT